MAVKKHLIYLPGYRDNALFNKASLVIVFFLIM